MFPSTFTRSIGASLTTPVPFSRSLRCATAPFASLLVCRALPPYRRRDLVCLVRHWPNLLCACCPAGYLVGVGGWILVSTVCQACLSQRSFLQHTSSDPIIERGLLAGSDGAPHYTQQCVCLLAVAQQTESGRKCPLCLRRITRNNLGVYKPQVIGLPVLLFVTGVVSACTETTAACSSNQVLHPRCGSSSSSPLACSRQPTASPCLVSGQ